MSCPICTKPTDPACRPFCSRRCADVDLARWLREDYRLPVAPEEMDETMPPAPGAGDPGRRN
ncbi:MAG: DNA gyrase inhibitor YacG [Rhodobacteraceae bacterium]|nr:MAG: DNA gyrase inhibitor YacG [Paracoccaceae bacterium]